MIHNCSLRSRDNLRIAQKLLIVFLSLSLLLKYMYAYRGWVRVFTAEGNEVFHFGGCDPHEHVHGELVEVPFDGSSYLTLVLHTESEGRHVRSEFCVLEEGTSLSSGLCVCYSQEYLLNTLPIDLLLILPNPFPPKSSILQLPS